MWRIYYRLNNSATVRLADKMLSQYHVVFPVCEDTDREERAESLYTYNLRNLMFRNHTGLPQSCNPIRPE
jgi:hypothetical protein